MNERQWTVRASFEISMQSAVVEVKFAKFVCDARERAMEMRLRMSGVQCMREL